jgi:hypothetical protein
MIQKALLVLAIFGAGSIARAQVIDVEGGNKHTYFLSASNPVDCHMPFTNVTGKNVVLAYKRIASDFPFTWEASLCDNRNCHPDLKLEDSFATISKDAKSEFKVTVDPQGKADTATVQYVVYDNSKPNVKDTIQFTFILQWGAGLMETGNFQSAVYPNPATNLVNIGQLTSNTSVRIYGADSRLVKEAYVFAAYPQIDIKSLPTGFYFISFNQGEKLIRSNFVKQ